MSSKKPSREQNDILNYKGNIVVLAKPGSGKTYTVCIKIKKIIEEELLNYEGIIAISYTNKASKELKNRIKNINIKGSYFNTLDTFLLMEIIYPFGQHVFGNTKYEFKIYDSKDTTCTKINEIRELYKTDTFYDYSKLGELFLNGKILLESISALAIYILENSEACKKYLKSRYRYIFIDEYQDCGEEQHNIFLKIISYGIKGVAVGDPDQSIYGFSGKSSKYLTSLSTNNDFKTFYLTQNYRCNKSIIDYSLLLLDKNYKVNNCESRVFHKIIKGTQYEICEYIDHNILNIMSRFSIDHYNEVAILVRGSTTGNIVDNDLKTNHRYFKTTELDKNSSLWGGVFKRLLRFVLNGENSFEITSEFFHDKDDKFLVLYKKCERLKKLEFSVGKYKNSFIEVAKIIYPLAENPVAISMLENILKDTTLYYSYKEAEKNEIQIMTLHKSKGLEFKIVFHLDLYKYIIPSEGKDLNGIWGYNGIEQCLNLHYVGITRAIEACFLLTSTHRYNGEKNIKMGIDSIFLMKNGVNKIQNQKNSVSEVAATSSSED